MNAKEQVFNVLGEEGVGWLGGKTSFMIADETGLHINTVRKKLRELEKECRAYCCAPAKFWRNDGKTMATLVWFTGNESSIKSDKEPGHS